MNKLKNLKDHLTSSSKINYLEKQLEEKNKEIDELKKELEIKDKKLASLPQLSRTSHGKKTSDGKITYRNWWRDGYLREIDGFCDNIWFTRFLKFKFPDADYKINMFSVFEEHKNLTEEMEGKKVFYSAENLHQRFQGFNEKFGDYALDYVDFAMGYDLIDHPKYLRFPYWMNYLFGPELTEETVEKTVEEINYSNYEKTDNVALISSHDKWKTRQLITDDVEKITDIKYAGRWRNNTRDMWDKYNDNKVNYLKHFKFNICPENTLYTAYVTEKVFHSIKCDCIPLYAGGGDYLEPDILNHKAILTWNENKDNSETVEIFKNLVSDEKSYEEFKEEPPLLDNSSKVILKTFNELEKRFEQLIYD